MSAYPLVKYSLVKQCLQDFEQTLDDNHEMALAFPDYGGPFVLYATRSGGDTFIAFELLSDNGEIFTVVQNYSQLNFTVFSKLKANLEAPPRRAGFFVDEKS